MDNCGTAEVLKQQLQEEYGLPVFLQRILHQGVILDDQARLDSIVKVQLLLLPVHATASSDEGAEVAFALCHASEAGRNRSLCWLLAARADANMERCYPDEGCLVYVTPLYLAAEHGHAEIVRALLAAGADADTGIFGARGTNL